MTKEVMISIHSEQFSGDEAETAVSESATIGAYYEKNGSHYILYEENIEGAQKPVKNKLKCRENLVELIRSGGINVHMTFEEEEKHMADYHTPYGMIAFIIDTKKLCVTKETNRISISVDYTLEQNNEYLADCKILIEVCSAI